MRDRRGSYRRGGHYRIDERTGFQVRAADTAKEWTGTIVAREDYEPRHSQDFVRGRRDNMTVADPRPEPPARFQGPPGGPFLLVVEGPSGEPTIEIMNGNIMVYGGQDQITPADL